MSSRLQLIINYDIRRKTGMPMQDMERHLLAVLERMSVDLNSPIHKERQRNKFAEFADVVKAIETRVVTASSDKRYLANKSNVSLDASSLTAAAAGGSEAASSISAEVQLTLREEQKAFKSLIEVINSDLRTLDVLKQSLARDK